jgi:hypothetical protein
MNRSVNRFAVLALAVATTISCASAAPPIDRLEAAKLSINEAERVGALSDAPLELHVARELLDQAKISMAAKKFVEARRQADEAIVHAELGRAKSESAIHQRAAQTLREEIDSFNNELK